MMKNNEVGGAGERVTPKPLEYYLDLPYKIELWRAVEGGWVVQVRELPGCVSQGETAEEALSMIREAMQGWLEVALEMGDPIPEPRDDEGFSGKFVVRVPRSLHRQLVEQAEREGVSLNQYVNVALAGAVAAAQSPVVAAGRATVIRNRLPGLKRGGEDASAVVRMAERRAQYDAGKSPQGQSPEEER